MLLVEALAQVGACAALADERFAGKLVLFGGVDTARFRRQVVPGETVELQTELVRLTGKGGRGRGRASVGSSLACEAELLFVAVTA